MLVSALLEFIIFLFACLQHDLYRFGALFSPVFAVLEKRLRSTLSREPQTPHEQDFRDQFAGQLADSIGKFKDLVVEDPSQAQGLWAPLKDLLRDMDKHLKILNLKMASISPRLTSLSGTDIPLPGVHLLLNIGY